MNWLNSLLGFLGGGTVSKALDIALEKTEDVDKRNAMVMQYIAMREETRRQEISRVTIPWVDALHKMGRQLFWLLFAVGLFVVVVTGHADDLLKIIDQVNMAAGGGLIYTLLKGKGK